MWFEQQRRLAVEVGVVGVADVVAVLLEPLHHLVLGIPEIGSAAIGREARRRTVGCTRRRRRPCSRRGSPADTRPCTCTGCFRRSRCRPPRSRRRSARGCRSGSRRCGPRTGSGCRRRDPGSRRARDARCRCPDTASLGTVHDADDAPVAAVDHARSRSPSDRRAGSAGSVARRQDVRGDQPRTVAAVPAEPEDVDVVGGRRRVDLEVDRLPDVRRSSTSRSPGSSGRRRPGPPSRWADRPAAGSRRRPGSPRSRSPAASAVAAMETPAPRHARSSTAPSTDSHHRFGLVGGADKIWLSLRSNDGRRYAELARSIHADPRSSEDESCGADPAVLRSRAGCGDSAPRVMVRSGRDRALVEASSIPGRSVGLGDLGGGPGVNRHPVGAASSPAAARSHDFGRRRLWIDRPDVSARPVRRRQTSA